MRCAILVRRIYALAFAFGRLLHLRESTRPVIVQVRVEMRRVELLKIFRMLGLNGRVAQVLAHYGAVFGFHQGVIGSAIGPRLGELN